jgi:AMMECR1 domain-containing protein
MVRGWFLALVGIPFLVCIGRASDERHMIELAKASVVSAVTGKPLSVKFEAAAAKPVFVTIEVDGTIRGCRGDLRARTHSLDEEISTAARDAAIHDPRYRPLRPQELSHVLVTVTVVDGMTPLGNIDALTPEDGLILVSGGHTGVVLPWEGKDPRTRLAWAYRKAKVAQTASVSLSRLIATRFRG